MDDLSSSLTVTEKSEELVEAEQTEGRLSDDVDDDKMDDDIDRKSILDSSKSERKVATSQSIDRSESQDDKENKQSMISRYISDLMQSGGHLV